MALLLFYSGPMQTTAAFAGIATGTTIKTLLQIRPSATLPAKVIEWGISLDGTSNTTPGKVELVETDVAATVTAYTAADITKLDGEALACGDVTINLIQTGTSASGYNATAEGSITQLRNLDGPQYVSPMTQFVKQFPLGREPVIRPNQFGRIRVHFPATVNAVCYAVVQI